MAASLTELSSRLVLPADPAAVRAGAAEAEALRRRLLARARMRDAADWLARRPQLGWDVFAHGIPAVRGSDRGSYITDLLRACLVALHVPAAPAAAYRPRPPPLWRVSDALPVDRDGTTTRKLHQSPSTDGGTWHETPDRLSYLSGVRDHGLP